MTCSGEQSAGRNLIVSVQQSKGITAPRHDVGMKGVQVANNIEWLGTLLHASP